MNSPIASQSYGLADQMEWPLSRLYHEESKLAEHKALVFQERIAAFSAATSSLPEPPYRLCPTRPRINLPRASRWRRGGRLRAILRRRRTRRGEFAARPVGLRHVGTLLEMACGETGWVRHPEQKDVGQHVRAWPSAGGLYPIETYLAVLSPGELGRSIYHYQVQSHTLVELGAAPSDADLHALVYAEGFWHNAALMIILTGVFSRTQAKYGERGYRFIHLDAGHLAQNLLLVCDDLGLAIIPFGGFCEDGLARVLGLDSREESPLYVFLLGYRC